MRVASATVTGSNATTVHIWENGITHIASGDPWYWLFRSLAELFLAGEIDLETLQDHEVRWSADDRKYACPAAREMLAMLGHAWMEPTCLHDPYIGCHCPSKTDEDVRARLRQMMGLV